MLDRRRRCSDHLISVYTLQVPRSIARPGTSKRRSKVRRALWQWAHSVLDAASVSTPFVPQVGRCNVATGPQRVAGAPKPVQIDMRNENFDEGFAGATKKGASLNAAVVLWHVPVVSWPAVQQCSELCVARACAGAMHHL